MSSQIWEVSCRRRSPTFGATRPRTGRTWTVAPVWRTSLVDETSWLERGRGLTDEEARAVLRDYPGDLSVAS